MSLEEQNDLDLEKANNLFDMQNYQASFELFMKLANRNDINAQNMLGYIYWEGFGRNQNESKAIYWWNKASRDGSRYAQFQLADIYIRDNRVKKGLNLLKISAKNEYAEAIYSLGGLYYYGTYVKKDFNRAIELYEKAMLLDHKEATRELMRVIFIKNGFWKTFLISLKLSSKYIISRLKI
ncbi:MAG: tetratricopeptide repeat protein [Sulfurovum sp.]